MNIYKIRTSEIEWVCANTLIEALNFYLNFTGMDLSEFNNTDDIEIVPRESWKDINIIDPEEYDDELCEYKVIESFEGFMRSATTPEIICTTAY